MALYEDRKVCVATYKRVWQQAFEMLEPTALRGARWVLRGEGGGNASFLPDYGFDRFGMQPGHHSQLVT